MKSRKKAELAPCLWAGGTKEVRTHPKKVGDPGRNGRFAAVEWKGHTMAKQIEFDRRSALYTPNPLFSYEIQGETHKLGSFTR